MKITYLGTAAAEGAPAVFCSCEYCCEARRLGGKDIRTRSQTIINHDLLIDLPADTYSHFLNNGIEGDRIKYLLITHSHQDHFYPDELQMRGGAYAHNMHSPELKVLCGDGAYKKLEGFLGVHAKVSVNCVQPFEKVDLGEYTVTPIPARHYIGDGALIYIIQSDKTILYAHDTGYLYDEVIDYIEKNQIKFDLISLDCTYVNVPIDDSDGHMGLDNIRRLIERLTLAGAVTGSTVKVINHFSHNALPIQHQLEKQVEKDGLLVAYDGFTIEI